MYDIYNVAACGKGCKSCKEYAQRYPLNVKCDVCEDEGYVKIDDECIGQYHCMEFILITITNRRLIINCRHSLTFTVLQVLWFGSAANLRKIPPGKSVMRAGSSASTQQLSCVTLEL